MAAAAKTKRFTPHEGVNLVRIPFQHLDRDVVIHGGKVYETSDPTVIAALEENDHVKAYTGTAAKTKAAASSKPADAPETAARSSSSTSSTAATPPAGATAPSNGDQGGKA